jgi:MSHA pilin protein MshC
MAGFTLAELVLVMIITSILAAYAAARYFSRADTTGLSQAQRFAHDLRHTQILAASWGRQLVVIVAGSNYSVGCAVASTAPCTAATPVPVTDPATGAAFSVTLQDGATLAGPATVRFDSMGRPSTGAAPTAATAVYTLSAGGSNWTITVNPVTGLVVAP